MKAKRKLTLSITLVAALLMALLTAGTALASASPADEVIEVVGTVVGWSEVDSTVDLEVEIVSDPTVDPPLTETLTVLVGQNFVFTTIAVGDILEITGVMNDEGILVCTDLKIQERIKDQVKSQDGEGDAYFCAIDTEKVHPIAEKISITYEVPYEDILGLLCAENPVSLGQIMLALQTAALTGEDYTTYLTGDMDEFHWGQIWQEFDVTGKPDKGIPPGEIKKGDKSEEGEGKDDQGNKNKDGEEECDELLCEVFEWFQKGKK